VRKPEVHVVSDRREAIARAIAIARPRDAVLITGKGNEKFLVLPGNERISWNEPQLVAELLSK
jgi:UDP-N-acetylmuramyl tripeptide synthase